jgi:two-component system, NarL family, response regulator DesR
MRTLESPIRILCVDDNEFVGESLKRLVRRTEGLEWLGWLESADDLVPTALDRRPGIVILDYDMPGKSSIEAIAELAAAAPEIRVIVFSGHVRPAFIEQSLQAGAWGYISKNDGTEALLGAIGAVAQSRVALSPEARAAFEHATGQN